MTPRIYNYSAFYVASPFNPCNLGATATPDFCYYQTLKAWKGKDSTFPFYDAHGTTYNVRDNSDWELTLKPRLHQRLRNAENIILFLSKNTKLSRALREEIEYGVGYLKLPVIVIYPDYKNTSELLNWNKTDLSSTVKSLWDNIPSFKRLMNTVPSLHIPMSKSHIERALINRNFTIHDPSAPKYYFYTC